MQDYAQELLTLMGQFKRIMHRSPLFKDLHRGEIALLHAIFHMSGCRGDELRMSQLSDQLHLSRPAVSQLAGRLEERGLLERYFSPGDRRATFVRLTDRGREIFSFRRERLYQNAQTVVDALGEEDAAELIRLLGRLNAVLLPDPDDPAGERATDD